MTPGVDTLRPSWTREQGEETAAVVVKLVSVGGVGVVVDDVVVVVGMVRSSRISTNSYWALIWSS